MNLSQKHDEEEDTEALPAEEHFSATSFRLSNKKRISSDGHCNKRCILLVLSVAVLLVLAVGLTLGLVLRKDKDAGSSLAESSKENLNDTDQSDVVHVSPTLWPHAESDIPLNPELRWGQLENNGFRYMFLRHPWPHGKVSMRMHFDVGSLQEDDDQLGLAHFLEHMLFNGLRNFAGNDVIAEMQRVGMAFGPHINAYTTFHETVYILDTPDNTTALMDLCFTVLRDWLDGALLEDEAVEDERGVVLAELWGGDLVRERLNRQLYQFLMPDTLIPSRWPIGTVESLQTLSPQ